jgi:hypothetical protein
MFKIIFLLFLTSMLALSACGTLEISVAQDTTPAQRAISQPPAEVTLAPTPTPAPTVTPTAPVVSTAGWQTYQNALYSFSVQYPPEATILVTRNESASIEFPVEQGTSLFRKYVEISVLPGASSCPSTYGALHSSENITVQDQAFLHETGVGVASGRYDWESYSTTKDAVCVNLTFILRYRPDISIPAPVEAETFPPILSSFTWAGPSTGNGASLMWQEENYTGAYSFRYPVELYSIRAGSANLAVNWPGVIELSPNDNFNQALGQPVSQTYRILVAVRDNTEGWTTGDPTAFMSGAGVLLQHAPNLIDENHPIREYRMGEAALLRLDDLPTGQAGDQTHIMTIYNNKIYEWLIEPAQSSGDERNMRYVEMILLTFQLE